MTIKNNRGDKQQVNSARIIAGIILVGMAVLLLHAARGGAERYPILVVRKPRSTLGHKEIRDIELLAMLNLYIPTGLSHLPLHGSHANAHDTTSGRNHNHVSEESSGCLRSSLLYPSHDQLC